MKKVIGGLVIVLIVAATYWFTQLDRYEQKVVTINDTDFIVDVVRSLPQQIQGLSGRQALELHRGMLFEYNDAKVRDFWMKGMNFPIDIVWIQHGRIVGYEEDVLPPEEGELDTHLSRYSSEFPVDLVLELQAGAVTRFGFFEGMEVFVNNL